MNEQDKSTVEIRDPLTRWRLIFGSDASDAETDDELLSPEEEKVDKVLEKLYGHLPHTTLKNQSPEINKWLGDIKKYFPTEVTLLLQKDALERLGITKMLLKPELLEQLEVDVNLVAAILNLQSGMPEETKESARKVIAKLVQKLEEKLSFPLLKAIHGSSEQSVPKSKPRKVDIDWPRTIKSNLKHYQKEYGTIIPHRLYARNRKAHAIPEIILCVDQSASMSNSVVYASIYACVLAQVRSVNTSLILFDVIPYDFSQQLADPVELLFGLNLGGGTDINRAVKAARNKIIHPQETIFFLITDLEEGGNSSELIEQLKYMHESGVSVIILLTLSDDGKPRYESSHAQVLANYGIPIMACTPEQFPELVGNELRKSR